MRTIQPQVHRKKNIIGMAFVLIPAGVFEMGSRLSQNEMARRYGGRSSEFRHEKPLHPVEIKQPFYMQTTPVTRQQWKSVMGSDPESCAPSGDGLPVENVSWHDAQVFIDKINELEGAGRCRLPSEAEWEYSCRARTDEDYFFGGDVTLLGKFAWYKENSGGKTRPAGKKKPNAFGLHDMHGNVCEWVEDDWHNTYAGAPADGRAWVDFPRAAFRVLRGGGWRYLARHCRSAAREAFWPEEGDCRVGFRLAMTA